MTKKLYAPIHRDFTIRGQSGTNKSFYENDDGYCYGKSLNGIPYSVDITANTANAKNITLQTNDYFNKISSDHIIGFANETASLSAYPDQYHTFNGYTITGGTLTSNKFKITQNTTAKANFSLKNGVTTFSASGDFGNGWISGNGKTVSNYGFLWLSASANVPSSWTAQYWGPVLMFPLNAAANTMIKVNYDFSAIRFTDSAVQDPCYRLNLTNTFRSASTYYSGFEYFTDKSYYNLHVNEMPFTSHNEDYFYIENPLSAYRVVNSLFKHESGNNYGIRIYNATWTATGIRL